jgi:predicted nuclease of restriction endonuclease-like (RecB) superfamily
LTNLLASPQEYEKLLGALKQRIRSAQVGTLRLVNREQISLYLDIGRMIVERQQGNTWGKAIVGNLARDLREEFPGSNGFSAANLWRMKNFYEAYGASEKLAPLVREIGWSHNISLPFADEKAADMHCDTRAGLRGANPHRFLRGLALRFFGFARSERGLREAAPAILSLLRLPTLLPVGYSGLQRLDTIR